MTEEMEGGHVPCRADERNQLHGCVERYFWPEGWPNVHLRGHGTMALYGKVVAPEKESV